MIPLSLELPFAEMIAGHGASQDAESAIVCCRDVKRNQAIRFRGRLAIAEAYPISLEQELG